jgi:limonene-1,2-epoxide hydrolase
MNLTIKEIAEAFSTHKFKIAYPYFLDNIHWNLVGSNPVKGKEAVISNCDQSAKYMASIVTKFMRFKVIAAVDCVVIDSLAEYKDQEQNISLISSCNIYEFLDGKLSVITSYCVELK